jgi:hypothetical protein
MAAPNRNYEFRKSLVAFSVVLLNTAKYIDSRKSILFKIYEFRCLLYSAARGDRTTSPSLSYATVATSVKDSEM